MKVLSRKVKSPRRRAISAIERRSVILNSGLDGVSRKIPRVCGRIAPSTACGSVVSTKLTSIPCCGRTGVR